MSRAPTALAAPRPARSAHVPRALPLVGHAPYFLRGKLAFLERCAASGSRVVELRLRGPTYLVLAPEDIRHVLTGNHANYPKSPAVTRGRGRRLFGPGLLTRSGADHRRHRRMLQPAFHHQAVSRFAATVVECAEELAEQWRGIPTVDVARDMMLLAQQVIARALLGSQSGKLPEVVQAIEARRRYIDRAFLSPLPFADRLPSRERIRYRRAGSVLARVVDHEIAARRASGDLGEDLLGSFLAARYDDGSALTDDQIRSEVSTFAVTGHESLGDALAWTLWLVGEHPETERRLVAELEAVLNGRRPTAADLTNLRYTQMVIGESLRLYPPTWLFLRVARDADTLPSGARIPRGAKLYLSQYAVHHDPRHFPAPERFDPSRFAPEAVKTRPRHAYFPFGSGPRVCIGETLARMELALVLATLVPLVHLTPLPGHRVEPRPRLTLRPGGGLPMTVEPRRRLP